MFCCKCPLLEYCQTQKQKGCPFLKHSDVYCPELTWTVLLGPIKLQICRNLYSLVLLINTVYYAAVLIGRITGLARPSRPFVRPFRAGSSKP